jgi:NAD(P)-dependent dehydrogenase (short-subunit alcohol dehydrogenase family)
MPDVTGRVAVVTGANSGLGLETSRALAQHGATVVMACRDEGRCAAAVDLVLRSAPAARVEAAPLDLADLDSVAAFADGIVARHAAISLLVNNAGVMAPPVRATTKQGFELQFGTNHLGHFALTARLLPALVRTAAARVVTVSSFAHESGHIDFSDLQRERSYSPYGAYSASKVANLLFMLELARRLRAAGTDAISVGAHPGFASTNLQAKGPFLGASPISSWLTLAAVRLIGQSAAEGAEPQLFAATAPEVANGDYVGPRFRMRGHPVHSSMAQQARDETAAALLWEASKTLTGVDIDKAIHSGKTQGSSQITPAG